MNNDKYTLGQLHDIDLYNLLKLHGMNNVEPHKMDNVNSYKGIDVKIHKWATIDVIFNGNEQPIVKFSFNHLMINCNRYKINLDDILSDSKGYDYITVIDQLDWQKQGLTKTETGYGTKIPTIYKVFHNGRLYRLYTDIYSNAGVSYILPMGEKLILR